MALSAKCPKCNHSSFEEVSEAPNKYNYKLLFTRCTHCGTVVGASEDCNISSAIDELAKKLNVTLDNLNFI